MPRCSIADILNLNPGLTGLGTGARPSLPCYPWFDERRHPRYYGGDMAFGQFAGGNQRLGARGLRGAAAAGQVVRQVPGRAAAVGAAAPTYSGSLAPDGGQVEEPVYFFVDLLAPFQVCLCMFPCLV